MDNNVLAQGGISRRHLKNKLYRVKYVSVSSLSRTVASQVHTNEKQNNKNLVYQRKIRFCNWILVFCDKAGLSADKAVCKENPGVVGDRLGLNGKTMFFSVKPSVLTGTPGVSFVS